MTAGDRLAPGANAAVEPKKSYGWCYEKSTPYQSSKKYLR